MALHPVLLACLACVFCWAATAFGAAFVFLIPRTISGKWRRLVLDVSLGFAAGVMLAASFWGQREQTPRAPLVRLLRALCVLIFTRRDFLRCCAVQA